MQYSNPHTITEPLVKWPLLQFAEELLLDMEAARKLGATVILRQLACGARAFGPAASGKGANDPVGSAFTKGSAPRIVEITKIFGVARFAVCRASKHAGEIVAEIRGSSPSLPESTWERAECEFPDPLFTPRLA